MNNLSTNVDASQSYFNQNGRKGISYDWQSLYAKQRSRVHRAASTLRSPRAGRVSRTPRGCWCSVAVRCAVHRSAAAA